MFDCHFQTVSIFLIEKSLPWCLEWLTFLNVKRNNYIGNPRVSCHRLGIFIPVNCWDRANLHYSNDQNSKGIGPHALCDVDGNSLKLSDIKDGMSVKIRAKHVTYPGYEYLFTAEGIYGMYFASYYIKA